MSVDVTLAQWLKEGSLKAAAADAPHLAAWGNDAIETDITSCFATQGAAAAEAARQLDFLRGPLAIEVLEVPGLLADRVGRVVTIKADQLGYATGLDAFVIGAAEKEGERTELTVLRRLG